MNVFYTIKVLHLLHNNIKITFIITHISHKTFQAIIKHKQIHVSHIQTYCYHKH